MRIGFYAPLKPPDSPRPSGDRRMARLLVAAMQAGGHDVRIAARLRSRDSHGDPLRQDRLQRLGQKLANRLIRRWSGRGAWRPEIWFTYHLYYKAPDWIGPAVAEALSIPYVVAEASHAPKRRTGPWQSGHRAVEHALRRASLVIGLNRADRACVAPLAGARYAELRPFIAVPDPTDRPSARATLAERYGLDRTRCWLLAVAMMRSGAKLASYRLLGQAMNALGHRDDWQLLVVGDGPARPEVEQALAVRAVFAGQLCDTALRDCYSAADLFVWPAIDEAYGMALLEAQSHGLPAVAGDSGGVGDILRHGRTGLLCPPNDAPAFTAALETLLDSASLRQRYGRTARRVTANEHGFAAAAEQLKTLIATAGHRCPDMP